MRKRTALAAVAAVALAGAGLSAPATAAPGDYRNVITFTGFDEGSPLLLNGSANVADGALRLTGDQRRLAGSAWSEATIDPRRSFESTFHVAMTGEVGHADGVAFVLQNDGPRALGGYGGSLGYGGLTHSVAVELDTFRNPQDVDNNHIAVVTGGASDAAQEVVASSPVQMFGQNLRVRVTYLAESTTLKVRVRADGSDTEVKVLQTTIDLGAALGGKRVWPGFTGGTGEDVSVQAINDWKLKTRA